jgi:hypothetical protein
MRVTGSQVELVWNKGIAALCDRRIPDEFPDGQGYSANSSYAGALMSSKIPDNLITDPSALHDLRSGEVVWVRLSWLRSFIRQVLPWVKNRFILVTGDSDNCVPSELMPEARTIFNCSNVMRWYAQNYDGSLSSEKISPIPIGIDFHSLSEGSIWHESTSSPLEQEQTLRSIQRSVAPVKNRIPDVYLDFAWRRGWSLRDYRRFHPLKGASMRGSRRSIVSKLRKKERIFCQSGPLARSEMWRRRGEYAFVLSPHGVGLDCHRTWEALALGHIVLTPSSSLDSLYSGLPVIALRDWSDITPENLNQWLSLYPHGAAEDERLTSRYWTDRMRTIAAT